MTRFHPHPCRFRLHRVLDRGWGEIACEYRWDSSSGIESMDDAGLPDLEHCFLYEFTTYEPVPSGWFIPPNPPFLGWRFRDPTDGRRGPVGLERFSAAQGWAWDRHKFAGPLTLSHAAGLWSIQAQQRYCFHCEICGCEGDVDGPASGPHSIVRTFQSITTPAEQGAPLRYRYEITKHNQTAWMEIDRSGYVADSARLGFGPSWLQDHAQPQKPTVP
jgi:hypothetical protein